LKAFENKDINAKQRRKLNQGLAIQLLEDDHRSVTRLLQRISSDETMTEYAAELSNEFEESDDSPETPDDFIEKSPFCSPLKNVTKKTYSPQKSLSLEDVCPVEIDHVQL